MSIWEILANGFEPVTRTVIELVNKIIPLPFMMEAGHIEEFNKAIFETLDMMIIPGLISLVIGLILGVLIFVVRKGGILENKIILKVMNIFIDFFRSIPFIILAFFVAPLSMTIFGTKLGTVGFYIPLIFGVAPFMARQVESSLAEIDDGLIEATIAMGCNPIEIIFRVYLKESIPSIARGTAITFISLLGLVAMGGLLGSGGLGNFALRYGYQRNIQEATYVAIVVILIIVSIVQGLGNYINKKTTH